ncbi:bifunctional phosphopantothenoylcysteine decarboxylase/phosphopantothenate--cysteine ligase CoaBC [Alphaproteobacteria bacterium]|nr:bifunctional phosphopantothenoylcysteine decarboxylase/phosphopantothenate--cysteine ligase CoaBC [Alphaproteobacteria bacterium]
MNNISHLISVLGGTGLVAKKLRIKPSAVSNWKRLNKIPKNKLNTILSLSSQLNINIEDYLPRKNLNNFNVKILLIICGGIASYKSLEIIRLMKKANIDLDVVITKSAQKFITPLLVTSLNEKKCYTDLFSVEDESKMNHIMLARNPDYILVAPATANIMAKLANGIADDLASTILLASFSQIILAPSMNPIMWGNLATQENFQKLLGRGIEFIGPDVGNMACGESGTGRFSEPRIIFDKIISNIIERKNKSKQFKDISIIITAGPTIENIDPVRFISNRSSGKQGFAIASELSKRGAKVTLISGPVNIPYPKCANVIQVSTAEQMFEKTMSQLPTDILICSAAVADWKLIPETFSKKKIDNQNKIKKTSQELLFKTSKNPDILATVAKSNLRPSIVIGFSAETNNLIENAKSKLVSKEIDLIVANYVGQNKVFGKDFNKVFLVDKNGCEEWSEQSKNSVASNLADKINKIYISNNI